MFNNICLVNGTETQKATLATMKQKYEDIKTQHNHSITMNMQKKEEIEIAKQFFEEHERLTEENLNTVIERTKVFLRKV